MDYDPELVCVFEQSCDDLNNNFFISFLVLDEENHTTEVNNLNIFETVKDRQTET